MDARAKGRTSAWCIFETAEEKLSAGSSGGYDSNDFVLVPDNGKIANAEMS
jgi:hypothetical protein